MKINGKNETVTLINEGEANILKSPGLTDVDFELLLPAVQYPFAVYPNGFRPAKYYLDMLEALMSAKSAFQYVVTRTDGTNQRLFDTSMKVSIESYDIVEDAGEGLDVTVKVKLRQYREFTTKACTIDISLPKPRAAMRAARAASSNAPSGVSYTVKNESIEHFFSICILEPNRITISNVDSSVHKAEFEHSGADLPLRRNLHLFFHRRHIRRAIMLYQ